MNNLLSFKTWELLSNPQGQAQDIKNLIDKLWNGLPNANGNEQSVGKYATSALFKSKSDLLISDISIRSVDGELADEGCYGVIGQWYVDCFNGYAIFNGITTAQQWLDVVLYYREFYKHKSEEGINQTNTFMMMGQENQFKVY